MTIRLHKDPQPPWKQTPNPNCKCGEPLHIVIPQGKHIHPCPVHPKHAIYGRQILSMTA